MHFTGHNAFMFPWLYLAFSYVFNPGLLCVSPALLWASALGPAQGPTHRALAADVSVIWLRGALFGCVARWRLVLLNNFKIGAEVGVRMRAARETAAASTRCPSLGPVPAQWVRQFRKCLMCIQLIYIYIYVIYYLPVPNAYPR